MLPSWFSIVNRPFRNLLPIILPFCHSSFETHSPSAASIGPALSSGKREAHTPRFIQQIWGGTKVSTLYLGSMEPTKNDDERKTAKTVAWDRKLTVKLLLVAIISSLGSVQYGYNLWVFYSPSVLVQHFLDCGNTTECTTESPSHMLRVAVSVSMFAIGGTVGSILMGPVVDYLGRKGALHLNSYLSIAACLFILCAAGVHSFEFIMFTRFLIGITSGVFSSAVPIYLAEISPVNSRGLIGMVPHLFQSLGVLLAQILALPEVMGTPKGWPILMSLSGILALFQIIIVPSFPESPRYLLMQMTDQEKARQALRVLRGQEDVEKEMREIWWEDLYEYDEEKNMNALKILCYPRLRWQVLSVIMLIGGQQLSGVSAVYYYTEKICQATEIGDENIRYISLLSTILIFISVLIVMPIVDLKGRKILLLIGFGVSGVLCLVLTITIALQNTWMAIGNTIIINVFLAGHAIGPSSLALLLTAELFLQSSRSSAYVVGGVVQWILHFFTVITCLLLQAYIGTYRFLVGFSICVITFFYIYKIVPETQGLTFLQIRNNPLWYKAKRRVLRMTPAPTELATSSV